MNIKISENFIDDARKNSTSPQYRKTLNKLMLVVKMFEKEDSINNFLKLPKIKKIVGKGLKSSNLWEYKIDAQNRVVFSIVETKDEEPMVVLLGLYTIAQFKDFLYKKNF
ncbi:hypothetical protein [Clostridium sp. DJ247]|uniref:hypothetical protein n=1 Tax=Clostridium sp. DJ247 TaxID=2726188 RepID=UPI0016296879|nr:hypothetical protein [Clostridium sp. DJ247]MBC2580148.1 hypothetical protein [Clostridium sp. DJ247]